MIETKTKLQSLIDLFGVESLVAGPTVPAGTKNLESARHLARKAHVVVIVPPYWWAEPIDCVLVNAGVVAVVTFVNHRNCPLY